MKVYQFTATDKFGWHPRKLLRHFQEKLEIMDIHVYNYGTGHYLKELRKLRRRIKGGTEYTFAQYKTKNSRFPEEK